MTSPTYTTAAQYLPSPSPNTSEDRKSDNHHRGTRDTRSPPPSPETDTAELISILISLGKKLEETTKSFETRLENINTHLTGKITEVLSKVSLQQQQLNQFDTRQKTLDKQYSATSSSIKDTQIRLGKFIHQVNTWKASLSQVLPKIVQRQNPTAEPKKGEVDELPKQGNDSEDAAVVDITSEPPHSDLNNPLEWEHSQRLNLSTPFGKVTGPKERSNFTKEAFPNSIVHEKFDVSKTRKSWAVATSIAAQVHAWDCEKFDLAEHTPAAYYAILGKENADRRLKGDHILTFRLFDKDKDSLIQHFENEVGIERLGRETKRPSPIITKDLKRPRSNEPGPSGDHSGDHIKKKPKIQRLRQSAAIQALRASLDI